MGSNRFRFDIAQHRPQVAVIVNHGAPESSLPHMARAAMTLVVAPRCERFKDATDRSSRRRSQEKMKMIASLIKQ